MKKKKIKNMKTLIIVLVIVLLAIILGVSYAVFNYVGIGSLVNSISTETVTMVYTEGNNKISVENAMPTEDSAGMKLTTGDNVFDFTIYIKATYRQAIAYEVTAEKDAASTLDNNDVRLYLEKSTDKTNYNAVLNPSSYVPIIEDDKFGAKTGEMVLDTGTTSREQTYYYKLRMWVSKDYVVTGESKFFTVRINVYGIGSDVIDADNVILNKTNITMKQNESQKLSATIKPDNASDKRVKWTTSDPSVAIVDSDGNVTGTGEGDAVITATAKDGEKATCNVTVTKPDPTDIVTSVEKIELKTNKETEITATVMPENVNDSKLTWSSSDESIVTIEETSSKNRVSTAKVKSASKSGTAVITIAASNGLKKKINVNVTNQESESVTIDKAKLDMITGDSETLTATVTPEDTIDKSITWTSSNTDVATVTNGKVTAVAPGTATITATNGSNSATSSVTVRNPLPTGVNANGATVNMKSGTTHQINATVSPSNARSKKLTYASSNPLVAEVSENGLITALGAGSTTITLTTINGLTSTMIVNVTNVKYTVNHNKMDLDGVNYTKADTETFSGKVGDKVTPAVKEYTGFNSPSAQTITLTEDDATIDYNYDRKKYTLTLTDVKGADTNGSTATGKYYYETPITLKAIAKTGYTWSKWSDGETENERNFKLTKDVSVSPVVTTNTYTIDYDLAGGEITNKNPDTYTVETERFTLNNPTKKGYTFAGWSGSNGTTPSTTVTVETGTTGKLSYTANWSKDTYKITYNLNDGKVSTANPSTYTVTDDAITLNNPSKTGYTFTGWTGSNGDTPQKTVSIEKGSVGDKTYNANYTANKYTVIFNKNSDKATGDMDSESFTYDNIKTLSSNTFKRSGYKFASWNTKEDGKGTSYADNSSVSNLSSTDGDTVNLYAIWTRDEYTINYNLNGGSLSGEKTSYNVDDNDLTLPIPAKNGYTFNGWTDDAGNKVTTIPSGSTGNKTFNANWTLNTYTITYNLGDKGVNGTGNPASYTVEDKDVTLTSPTRNGYTFTGWTGSNGNAAQTSVTIKTSDAENKTYTANWSANTYSITYNCNGGSGCTNGHYNIENDDITLPTPTRQGYTFTGWTGSNGTTPETTVKIPKGSTGDKSYTANWIVNKYTVTWNPNGGTVTPTSTIVTYGLKIGTLPVPERSGYKFNGWFASSTEGTQISSDTIVEQDITYFAQWIENATTKIIDISKENTSDFIIDTSTDGNLRYVGKNPNNNVQFNDELWRIIGVMNNVDDGTGKIEKRIKLIRKNNIGAFSWDTSDSSVNGGYGVNEWSQADIMKLLNPGYENDPVNGSLYWNRKSGTCYAGANNATTSCDFSSSGLNDKAKTMIDNAVWNIGAISGDAAFNTTTSITALSAYNDEHGSKVGKTCSGGAYCNDSVTRNTKWVGKVGLVTVSDYGFATSGGTTYSRDTCMNSSIRYWYDNTRECAQNDWIRNGAIWQWTMNPHATSDTATDVQYIKKGGNVANRYAFRPGNKYESDSIGALGIRPVVYLKSSISIVGGSGTTTDPYILSE